MRILVLDAIHGGTELARRFTALGYEVDLVDIYRHEGGTTAETALSREYGLIVAPIHTDPAHPLLQRADVPVISHHEAVAILLEDVTPAPFVEITGKQGKTTTACALASVMQGTGIVHTSSGTWAYPEKRMLWKRSITPASVLPAAEEAFGRGGWLIAEESLGVTGAGALAILTSFKDYSVASGRKSALLEKLRPLSRCPAVIVPPGACCGIPHAIDAGEVAHWKGDRCWYRWEGIDGFFINMLGTLPAYRIPLTLAAAAACVLGTDPAGLASFSGVRGRMQARYEDGTLIVDNANSGADYRTTIEAARYARSLVPGSELVLVVGAEAENICEGFPAEAIDRAIGEIMPAAVIVVGEPASDRAGRLKAVSLDEGLALARTIAGERTIVLSVKTWR
jgi:hypothetical protein